MLLGMLLLCSTPSVLILDRVSHCYCNMKTNTQQHPANPCATFEPARWAVRGTAFYKTFFSQPLSLADAFRYNLHFNKLYFPLLITVSSMKSGSSKRPSYASLPPPCSPCRTKLHICIFRGCLPEM